ncbi:MAG: endonuclease [Candidatus Marinimicrobia bacterium]|nr:endonuclease [Candidatus Neomarinimicrobiota bacterium]
MTGQIKLLPRVLILLFLMAGFLAAVIPPGYYNGTESLSGNELRLALHNIIDDHTQKSYDYVWTAYATTDLKFNGKIWDMYTHIEFTLYDDQQTTGSDMSACYNREHSWPKSWANNTYPMYTDIFHLYPVQALANSYRNNNPYGEVGSATYTSPNGSKLGSARTGLGYTGTVFEPIDEYKGDLARTYFYMTTRYYTEDSNWGSSGMSDKCELQPWAIEMLLNWHALDPVSQKELDRNEAVYAIQGNRNPFIDDPDFADRIWNVPATGFEAPEARSASNIQTYAFTANWLGVSEASGYKLYVSESSSFSTHISGYGPKDVGNNLSETVSGLSASTTYYYRLKAYKPGEETAYSGIITVQTEPPSGWVDSTRIFFSEYIEGISYNKALEIYNGTGSDINLSNIQIKLYSNGAASSSSSITLSGALSAEDVYVIAYRSSTGADSADPPILAVADLTTVGVVSFNGNDYNELYYNNALIDVIGYYGNSQDLIKDVTLVRRSGVFQGSTDFDLGDWDAYPVNTFDYLGSHEIDHDTPLAIRLRNFSASCITEGVLLEWSTASEIENALFQIFRNDEFLASVEGAGTTSAPQNYEYIDSSVQPGKEYEYLLVDIAYDGSISPHHRYRRTIRIPERASDIRIGELYPNPGNPDMLLPLQVDAAAQITLTLFDLEGKKQRIIKRAVDAAGHYEIPLDLQNLRSGIYLLRIESGAFTTTRKIILLK